MAISDTAITQASNERIKQSVLAQNTNPFMNDLDKTKLYYNGRHSYNVTTENKMSCQCQEIMQRLGTTKYFFRMICNQQLKAHSLSNTYCIISALVPQEYRTQFCLVMREQLLGNIS